MSKFKVWIDEKQTIWQRHHYTIDAPTKEDADRLLKQEYEDMQLPDEGPIRFYESEFLFETIEYLTVTDNGGCTTREAFNSESESIANNAT